MNALRITLSLFVVFTAQSASPFSISFDQNSYAAVHGGQITVVVYYDFIDQPVYSIGASLHYDASALEFVSYDATTGNLGGWGGYSLGSLVAPGQYLNFGLSTKFFGGVSDSNSIGTFTFNYLGNVTAPETFCGYVMCLASSEYIPIIALAAQDITSLVFAGQDGLSADVRPVPLPAGAWLLMSGLGIMSGYFNKKKISTC